MPQGDDRTTNPDATESAEGAPDAPLSGPSSAAPPPVSRSGYPGMPASMPPLPAAAKAPSTVLRAAPVAPLPPRDPGAARDSTPRDAGLGPASSAPLSSPREAGLGPASSAPLSSPREPGAAPLSSPRDAAAARESSPRDAGPPRLPIPPLPPRVEPSVLPPPVEKPASLPPAAAATFPPRHSPWRATIERATREVDARGEQEPTFAALVLAAMARVCAAGLGDTHRAQQLLDRASDLAPGARFVETIARMVSEQGKDPMLLLARIRGELGHVGAPAERVALLWQAAAIEEYVAFDFVAAQRTLGEILTLEPNDIAAWEALGALFLRTKANENEVFGDGARPSDEVVFGGAVASLEAIAATTDDPVVRGALLGAVGALRDRWLSGDDAGAERAVAALRQAVAADESNVGAAATLESVLLRRRAWDEYAQVVEAAATRLVHDPRAAAESYERAGDVFTECLRDQLRAAACYARAAQLAVADTTALEKLVRVLETAGRWEEAAAAYELYLARVSEPTQRAWALVGLGTVQDRRLHRYDDALVSFRAAVDASPTYAPATQALRELARTRGLLPLVIEIERLEVERLADPRARAVRYAALAELLEDTGDPEEATLFYERALVLDPGNVEAFDALERLHRETESFVALASLYESALAATSDKRRARALRLDLAEVLQGRLGQPARAVEHLRLALEGADDRYATLVALGRALAGAGRWAEYVEALEAQAGMLAGADEIAAIYRIGHVLETRVRDLGRALATYEIVVDRAPRHEAALRAISRVHEQESRWDRVIDAERKLIELTTRPDDVVETLLRIARIAEEQLGRQDEAILAYQEALEHAPTHAPAIAALERLLRATGNQGKLVEVLERYADATTDRHVKVRALLRAATLAELCLADTSRAAQLYERALETAGTGGGLLDDDRYAATMALYRLHETRGEWEDVDRRLLALLEVTTEPSARIVVLSRLARNTELRLGDVDRAASFVDEALEVGAPAAAIAVDRLRLARLAGAADAIGASLGALGSSTTDGRLAMALVRVRALLEEHTNAPAAAASLYERLVAADGSDVQALEGLARSAARFAGDARLAPALLARARTTSDPPLRALLAFSAGVVDDVAVRTRDAEEAYAYALVAEPNLLPALDAARRLRVQAGDWDAVATLAERAGAAARDRENVAQAWLEAAKIHEDRRGDDGRALAAYQALLATQPEHALAHERALALVEAVGDFTTAEGILLAHAEAVIDIPTKVRAYSRRAALLAGRLQDVPGAIADLRKAIALRPHDDDPTVLEVLALLEERMKNWQEAIQLHRRIGRATTDLEIDRRARIAEARILAEELRDLPGARRVLEDLANALPGDRDVLLRLAAVAARGGDEARALEIYGKLTTTGSGAEKARGFLALHDLRKSRPDLWPAAEADAILARAFDLALVDGAVIPVLEERATLEGDFRPFATHAEAAIQRVPPTTPGILGLRTALARALREQLGNPTAADRQLKDAIQAFPDSMPTRLALATALRGRNDDAAVAELRAAVAHDPTAPEPYAALATLATATGRPGIAAMLMTASALLGGTGDGLDTPIADTPTYKPMPDKLLFDEAMQRFVGGPSRAWLIRQLLAALDPFLPKIFPGNEKILEASSRLPDAHPVAGDVRAIAAAVGSGLLTVAKAGTRDAMLLLTEPRAIVLGSDWLTDEGRPTAAFHAASFCARIAGHGSAWTIQRAQLVSLVEAVARPENEGPIVREIRKRIAAVLPRKNRKDLEKILETPRPPEATLDLPAELTAWEAEEARRSLSLAVLLSRDLRAAGRVLATDAIDAPAAERRRALAANPRVREALELAVSPTCWDAFKRVYGRS